MPWDLSTLPRSLYKYTFTLSLHFWSCVPDVAIFGSMENISSVRKMTFGPAPQDPGGAGVGNKRAITQPHLWVYVMVSNLTVTHIKPRIMICLTHLTSLAAIVETQSIVAQLGFDAVSSPPFWRNFQCTFWTVLALMGFQIFALFPRNFYNRHTVARWIFVASFSGGFVILFIFWTF